MQQDGLTLIYGEAGVGKTNLCLQLSAKVAAEGHKVLFLDTDGASIERLAQICQGDLERIMPSILFLKAYSLREQQEHVAEILRIVAGGADVGVVVVDGVGTLFRPLASSEAARVALAALVGDLQALARRHHIPVLATTQVYTDIDRQVLVPIGGHLVHYIPRCILHLERVGPHRRRATLIKHGHQPEQRWCEFLLGPTGIVDPPEGLVLSHHDATPPPLGASGQGLEAQATKGTVSDPPPLRPTQARVPPRSRGAEPTQAQPAIAHQRSSPLPPSSALAKAKDSPDVSQVEPAATSDHDAEE